MHIFAQSTRGACAGNVFVFFFPEKRLSVPKKKNNTFLISRARVVEYTNVYESGVRVSGFCVYNKVPRSESIRGQSCNVLFVKAIGSARDMIHTLKLNKTAAPSTNAHVQYTKMYNMLAVCYTQSYGCTLSERYVCALQIQYQISGYYARAQ